jgi:hypothetical protein
MEHKMNATAAQDDKELEARTPFEIREELRLVTYDDPSDLAIDLKRRSQENRRRRLSQRDCRHR